MAKPHKPSRMRLEIIKAATELFFENGFYKTTSTAVCRKAQIGTGNLTFYFPTKEHILAVLVKMLCDYQGQIMREITAEGKTSLLAYCLELTSMATISEQYGQMSEVFSVAYSNPLTLDMIRTNDVEKIKQVFGDYCKDWSEEKFVQAETIVSGIEFATLVKTEHSVPLPTRIEGALNSIMLLFGVPEETRKLKISKVFAMDYQGIGRQIYEGFKTYATETSENAIEEYTKNFKPKRDY